MATRLYPDPTNAAAVSPAFDSSWGQTSAAVRRALVIGTAGNNASTDFSDTETNGSPIAVLLVQFVSPTLNSVTISGTADWAFRCMEDSALSNSVLRVVVRKCDSDGGNPTTGDVITDTSEFVKNTLTNRYHSGAPSQTLSDDDRLVVEVGYYADNTKTSGYVSTVNITDNHATTDLGENDTDTVAYNSWVEFVETITEKTGSTIPAAAADTASFVDTGSRIATLRATSVDTMNTADTDAGLGQYLASLTDTAAAADTASTIATLLAAVTDTATVTDSVVGGLMIVATATDAAALSDAITTLLTLRGTATDTVTTADTAAAIAVLLATAADNATTSETVTALASLLATATDTGAFSESVVGGLLLLAATADTATLTDAVSKLLVRHGTAEDTFLIEEGEFNIYFPMIYFPRLYWPDEGD